MAEIKKFFECLIPVTVCNIKCDYCYIVQREHRTCKIPELKYSPEIIEKALRQERLGGVCYFSICGAGETFVPNYLLDVVNAILKNGHYVNITTNGTLSKKIKELSRFNKEELSRIHISFSFHYLELKKKSLLDVFFENVNYVKSLGCSVLIQLNLYDGYLPYLEDIKKICLERVGALPQIAATRKEESLLTKVEYMTSLSEEDYISAGKQFDSPLFDFTVKNFNCKRKEFCYAGSWTFTLNLVTGVMKRCYASSISQNIFENVDKPIMDIAVGNCCGSLFCMNSSHFMSLGVIPEIKTPTYSDLRNRKIANWYTDSMIQFLNGKLYNNNAEYSKCKRIKSNIIGFFDKIIYRTYQVLSSRKKKL